MEANIEEIVKALVKKTGEGDVVWNLSSSKDEFKLQLKDSTICISRKGVGAGRVAYVLQIYNANGICIINEAMESSVSPNILRDLYTASKDSFLKKDETLQSILRQVNGVGKIGEDDSLPF